MTIPYRIWHQHQYLRQKVPPFFFFCLQICPKPHQFSLLPWQAHPAPHSSSSGRKVEGGKAAVKRLRIPLHRGRFKAWLGLPWRHICLMINPKKPCCSRQQSFVSREEPWGPQKFWDYGALWSPVFLADLPLIMCHPSADAVSFSQPHPYGGPA